MSLTASPKRKYEIEEKNNKIQGLPQFVFNTEKRRTLFQLGLSIKTNYYQWLKESTFSKNIECQYETYVPISYLIPVYNTY